MIGHHIIYLLILNILYKNKNEWNYIFCIQLILNLIFCLILILIYKIINFNIQYKFIKNITNIIIKYNNIYM